MKEMTNYNLIKTNNNEYSILEIGTSFPVSYLCSQQIHPEARVRPLQAQMPSLMGY
jgi:hypothetical protein